jgi:hypothetical protein
MAKKAFVLVQPCAICGLRINDIKDSCVQVESWRRVHLECHQRDFLARENARLKRSGSQPGDQLQRQLEKDQERQREQSPDHLPPRVMGMMHPRGSA